ncbi:glycosyltransferase [Fodinicurvata sp. EGI_FJ10296]|uniref:glycosyltransferase n=1 Tax=Fodinicurvata sp. EGI_FJ10296 TaxID=3231908 RepID=UPI0034514ADD
MQNAARGALRLAFYSEADVEAFPSLKRNAARIDILLPDWFELERSGLRSSAGASNAHAWVQQERDPPEIFPVMSTALPAHEVHRLLALPDRRAGIIADTAEHLRAGDFDGVAISMPYSPRIGHRSLVMFLDQLRRALAPEGRRLVLMAPPLATTGHLRELSRAVDYVIVPTHGQAGSDRTGPIASQGRFEAELAHYRSGVAREKLIVSVGSYGREWTEAGIDELISVQQAWQRADDHGASISFDPATLNPGFRYRTTSDGARTVWYLDAVTAFNHLKAVFAEPPAGIAVWRLGLEDQGIWDVAGRDALPDAQGMASLNVVPAGYGMLDAARGALLSARPGAQGRRTTTYHNGLGLIVGQVMADVPLQARLAQYTAIDDRVLALTFDDGPDPVFTPRILDVLAQKDVKATFYVVGTPAFAHPDLMARIVAEGHDFGNHTFFHPDLTHRGAELIAAEITATQRLFEAQLGRGSLLFRPPFASTQYQYLERSPTLWATVSEMGYLFGGIDISAYDYYSWSPEQIAERVVNGVRRGQGQAILLHDSGGNRTPTVEALPIIIDTLRAEGYRFVTTHELVGLPRDALMPPLVEGSILAEGATMLRDGAIRVFRGLFAVLPTLFIATALFGMARLVLIAGSAIVQRRRQDRSCQAGFQGSVAVLVPAYNEETVICDTVLGLLEATVANQLVITVIDDGSTDRTAAVVEETFAADARVKVLRKPNGGKASALNHGFAMCDADVIVAIDGDTVLRPDAIGHLLAPFKDPEVGAVAGTVLVGNTMNLLTRFQALEYIVGQNLERTAFELYSAIGVVPGAIGAWRRTAVVSVGGYASDTLAEDGDLTIALQRAGWRVCNAPAAVALTEAPQTLGSFMKQRFRWLFGTLQVTFKHRGAFLARPGGVSLVTLPNVMFQYAFTLIAPLMDLVLVISLLSLLFSIMAPGAGIDNETLVVLALYWAVFQAFDLFAAGVGLALHGDRRAWRLLPLLMIQRFTYRQLLYVIAIRALLAAVRGNLVGWGKLMRTGLVVGAASLSKSMRN